MTKKFCHECQFWEPLNPEAGICKNKESRIYHMAFKNPMSACKKFQKKEGK